MKQRLGVLSLIALFSLPLFATDATMTGTPERPVTLSTASQTLPHAAQNDDGITLVVWLEGGQTIMARRIAPGGEPLGAPFVVATSAGATALDVATTGRSFLVIYGTQDIRGQYVAPEGTLRGTSFAIGSAIGAIRDTSVNWNGLKYLVTWRDTYTYGQASFTEYTGHFVEGTGGIVGDRFLIEGRFSTNIHQVPQLECDFASGFTGQILAACADATGVFADALSFDGSLLTSYRIADSGSSPRVAFAGSRWVVAWLQGSRLYRAPVGGGATTQPSADAVDTGIFTTNGSYQLASNPTGVIYTGGDGAVYAATFDADGNVVAPLTLLAAGAREATVSGGTTPVIAYTTANTHVAFRSVTTASTLPRQRGVKPRG